MAIKMSVVDIPIDDTKFQRFAALYQQYNDKLAKSPGIWQAVNKEFRGITAAVLAQNQAMRETLSAEREQVRHLTVARRLWTGIAGSARTVAGSVVSATASLLKWTGIFAGVGALFSPFALLHMASDVSDQRRTAMGYGTSIGGMKAFSTNFGRYVNPQSFLAGITEMRTNPEMQGALAALGVSPRGSTMSVAMQVLSALRQQALMTPTDQLGLILKKYQVSGVSVEDLMRMQGTGNAEWAAQMAHFQRDRSALNIDPKTALAWTNFTSQMERAGQTIFKTFVVGLAPLEKPLENLSGSFVRVMKVLMSKDGIIEKGIVEFAGWLDQFNGKINKPGFFDAIARFTSDVGVLAQAIHAVSVAVSNPKLTAYSMGLGGPPSMNDKGLSQVRSQQFQDYLSAVEKRYLLPSGVLTKLMMAESGGNPRAVNKQTGAQGLFQFMPASSKFFGINPFDPVQEADAAGRLFGTYYAKYQGDMEKAIAAWGGMANPDAMFAKYPTNWQSHLSRREIRNGLAREEYRIAGDKRFLVQINNATGHNVVVTVNGMAQ